MTLNASLKALKFIDKNRDKLQRIDNVLKYTWFIYMGLSVADNLGTYLIGNGPSNEVTGHVRWLMENYGSRDGLLLNSLIDFTLLGIIYKSGDYIERKAIKENPQLGSLPLFRNTIPYIFLPVEGAYHAKGFLSCLPYF